MSKRVFVGLSGGVDSAVSAALLKGRGYETIGAFIKIWSPEFLECTWREDRLDAMRVAAALQIPFLEVDLSDAYKREVVSDMIENYKRGVTPNPDVMCNRSIKFGYFAQWAFENGADHIATGHYARIGGSPGALQLLRGKDKSKDQSYFLYRLGQKDLERALFPVGDYEKAEVRSLAKKFDLPNANRPDSQGLCFVGDVSMKEFLSRFITLEQGDVVDETGVSIGKHDGAALYTVGERHGFLSSGPRAHYVIGIDVVQNIVRVSSDRARAARNSIQVSDLHWINAAPDMPVSAQGQGRYRERPFHATLSSAGVASFDEPHIVAPGQSLVLYDDEICLGGGVMQNS